LGFFYLKNYFNNFIKFHFLPQAFYLLLFILNNEYSAMALTPSTMLNLGTKAPEFTLIEPFTGKTISLADYKNQAVLIAFISNHCPYVILLKNAMQEFAEEYQAKGLAFIAINSNDIEKYPADSPVKMVQDVQDYNYNFPYLFDETQVIAANYKAACTPDFFLFDKNHQLFYRGQFDNARPNSDIDVTGIDMRNAANRLLQGKEAPQQQIPSIGCSIKWKPGKAPKYA